MKNINIIELRKNISQNKLTQRRGEMTREKRVRFLIVCEGSKTEPNYLNCFIKDNESAIRQVHIEGEGKGTMTLVDETCVIKKQLEKNNAMYFDSVWVVFDKDDFKDFNQAIEKAQKLGFKVAWSNESFELWYYLHFNYSETSLSRKLYIKNLEKILRNKMNDKSFKYDKGSSNIYNLIKKYGDDKMAKNNAKRLRRLYNNSNYEKHNPCTTVDLLIEELEFPNKILKQKDLLI